MSHQSMTLQELCEANARRQDQWPNGYAFSDDMNTIFVALEVAEEGGEVAGAVKKIIRHRYGIAGNKVHNETELLENLMEEIADAFINLARLCNIMGIDPDQAVRGKFNSTSRHVGVPVYL